jgi:hypothetical protein
MSGFFGLAVQFTSGGVTNVAQLGKRLAYTSPAGGAVAAAPLGFVAGIGPGATGRLLVTLTANTTWTSLTAGADGQLLEVKVVAGNFTLTLPQSAFNGVADLALALNNGVLMYYDATVGAWELTSP